MKCWYFSSWDLVYLWLWAIKQKVSLDIELTQLESAATCHLTNGLFTCFKHSVSFGKLCAFASCISVMDCFVFLGGVLNPTDGTWHVKSEVLPRCLLTALFSLTWFLERSIWTLTKKQTCSGRIATEKAAAGTAQKHLFVASDTHRLSRDN